MTDFTLPAGARHRQLIAELLAAFPALQPTMGPDGRLETDIAFEHDAQTLRIRGLPDTVDPATVQALIDAHVPIVEPGPDYGEDAPDLDRPLAVQVVQQLRAYLAVESPTAAQTVGVVKLLCRVALWSIRQRFRNGEN